MNMKPTGMVCTAWSWACRAAAASEIFLGLCDLNDQGFEIRGILLKAVQYAVQCAAESGDGVHE